MGKERAPILLADHSDVTDTDDVMSLYCNDLEGGSSDSDTSMWAKRSREFFPPIVSIVGAMAVATLVFLVMAVFGDSLQDELGQLGLFANNLQSGVWREEDVVRVPCIRSLQFSPHAECFEHSFDPSGSCANFVGTRVNDILNSTEYAIDFASIIYSNGNYRPLPWDQVRGDWGLIHGQCPVGGIAGPGRNFTEDDIILIYDKEQWTMIDGNASGCLGREFMGLQNPNEQLDEMRRPYVIRAFQNKGTLMKVLVAAAHFPHRQEYEENVWKLRNDIKNLTNTTGIENVLLMADTNLGGNMQSPRIFQDIGVTNLHRTQSTSLFSSCCYPAFREYGFDRVISNFGTFMENHHPFSRWDVLRWGRRNMHLPVIGTLRLNGTSQDRCEDKPFSF